MKNILCALSLIITLGHVSNANSLTQSLDSDNTFLGQWSIDIAEGGVGWLNIHEDQGFLDAELMWIGGSVTPIAHVYLKDDRTIVLTRTETVKKGKDSNGIERSHTITYTITATHGPNGTLIGEMVAPTWEGKGEQRRTFIGKRTPAIPARPNLSKVKYGSPISLFNGKNLDGWRIINPEQPNGFKAVDGILVTDPVQPENGDHLYYGNLRTDREFEDFNLKLEVNIPEENNSGVYLRGLYEIQVYDSYKKKLDPHHMGALYSRITPTVSAEKPHDTWQTMDITLCDRHVTVILNGTIIIDNQAVDGPTGGAISSDVLAPGPIYLQGDHGNVLYRNIILTPIIK
ncbi:MAG: hypothetical protein ACJA01_003121 [Saprospiraceae bacterium]|jgi:hypothetical protein